MRRRLDAAGYREVKTPQLMDARQWEASGHWGKYRENMFVVPDEVPGTEEDEPVLTGEADLMALKPMNCPAHVLIFRQGIKSYRDLPIRLAEFGCCHRNEPHGALHGIMRVRQFTQDDAHIFCREDQIVEEIRAFCDLLDAIYQRPRLRRLCDQARAAPGQALRHRDEMWDKAEQRPARGRPLAGRDGPEYRWEELPGEGAFYAPKLEFHLTDAIGRTWQCGTLQLDYCAARAARRLLCRRGRREAPPVMLHRAILGTFERFLGILIEHHAGRFPLWLAPVQAVVATIVSDADDYAREVVAALRGRRPAGRGRPPQREDQLQGARAQPRPGPLSAGRRQARGRGAHGRASARSAPTRARRCSALDALIERLRDEALPPDLRRLIRHSAARK